MDCNFCSEWFFLKKRWNVIHCCSSWFCSSGMPQLPCLGRSTTSQGRGCPSSWTSSSASCWTASPRTPSRLCTQPSVGWSPVCYFRASLGSSIHCIHPIARVCVQTKQSTQICVDGKVILFAFQLPDSCRRSSGSPQKGFVLAVMRGARYFFQRANTCTRLPKITLVHMLIGYCLCHLCTSLFFVVFVLCSFAILSVAFQHQTALWMVSLVGEQFGSGPWIVFPSFSTLPVSLPRQRCWGYARVSSTPNVVWMACIDKSKLPSGSLACTSLVVSP